MKARIARTGKLVSNIYLFQWVKHAAALMVGGILVFNGIKYIKQGKNSQ